jgi:MFS family permease
MAAAISPLQIYLIFGFQIASMMTSQVLLPTVLQDFAPAELRGRFVSLLGVVGVIGIAIGPPLVGWISDQFGNRPEGLMLSIVSMAGVGMLISAALFWAARKPYARAVAMAQGTFDNGRLHAPAA